MRRPPRRALAALALLATLAGGGGPAAADAPERSPPMPTRTLRPVHALDLRVQPAALDAFAGLFRHVARAHRLRYAESFPHPDPTYLNIRLSGPGFSISVLGIPRDPQRYGVAFYQEAETAAARDALEAVFPALLETLRAQPGVTVTAVK